MPLRGCFRILLLYDVAEAIDLPLLSKLLGADAVPVKDVFPRNTPDYVRFEQAPIVETVKPVKLSTGEQATCAIRYYAFAVAVVQFEVEFDCAWDALLERASRWIGPDELEPVAHDLVRRHLDRASPALVRPRSDRGWLQEEYLLINLQDAGEAAGGRPTAAELLAAHGGDIAQLIRGEVVQLAPKVVEEVLESQLSYYSSDLVVVGAAAALVYDPSGDAGATSQVLEYAKMQLLEFRYYDGLMTTLLSDVYAALERKRNVLLSRWSVPREAGRFNTIRLDVMELTERVDNDIKFVSDVYYARVYRLAAARIGLPEYRQLVDEKLRTTGELYDFMIDQFNEARSFVLELAVAILVLLDVILLLTGK